MRCLAFLLVLLQKRTNSSIPSICDMFVVHYYGNGKENWWSFFCYSKLPSFQTALHWMHSIKNPPNRIGQLHSLHYFKVYSSVLYHPKSNRSRQTHEAFLFKYIIIQFSNETKPISSTYEIAYAHWTIPSSGEKWCVCISILNFSSTTFVLVQVTKRKIDD